MQKSIFTLLIISLSLGLFAQTKGKINQVDKTTMTKKYPIKGGQIKGEQLTEPYLHDLALTKCKRHIRYQKKMWAILLNSSPSDNNPLELSKEISRLRFITAQNSTGNIVFDNNPDAISLPKITNLNPVTGNSPFPVPVSGTTILHHLNGATTTLGFHWETGSYGVIKKVKDIYKIGTQDYIEVVNAIGVTYSIKIFPSYLMDGCQIPTR